nr:hypothetical protein [Streptomyces sabulosicollis]
MLRPHEGRIAVVAAGVFLAQIAVVEVLRGDVGGVIRGYVSGDL